MSEPHDCETCQECIHDGNKCCGCYDGACCQRSPLPTWRAEAYRDRALARYLGIPLSGRQS